MSVSVETWNRRAGYLLQLLDERPDAAREQPSPLEQARATLAQWARLVATVPHRALSAAVHQGLEAGVVRSAVEGHGRGCLTLAGSVGAGKTVGAAWLAYRTTGSVLWLDAVEVGQAHPDRVAQWRAEIPGAGLVVVDDVGAGSSTGDWSSRKVADVVGSTLDRLGPSILAFNLDRKSFTKVLDGNVGRLASRASMPPNVWLDVRSRDRRPTATPPPDIDVLPPREARAHVIVQARGCLRSAHHAYALADVDIPAVAVAARALGLDGWASLDRAMHEHEHRLDQARALLSDTTRRLRLVVPRDPAGEEQEDEPDPGAAARRRASLLDLLAYVAEHQGATEADVLGQLGRTRRELGPEDEPRLLAMVAR